MDNKSLKNKNETKKEECSMMCAQKPNYKLETALKWLKFARIKFHAIQYNPSYYIQQKVQIAKKKIKSSDSKNIQTFSTS